MTILQEYGTFALENSQGVGAAPQGADGAALVLRYAWYTLPLTPYAPREHQFARGPYMIKYPATSFPCGQIQPKMLTEIWTFLSLKEDWHRIDIYRLRPDVLSRSMLGVCRKPKWCNPPLAAYNPSLRMFCGVDVPHKLGAACKCQSFLLAVSAAIQLLLSTIRLLFASWAEQVALCPKFCSESFLRYDWASVLPERENRSHLFFNCICPQKRNCARGQ